MTEEKTHLTFLCKRVFRGKLNIENRRSVNILRSAFGFFSSMYCFKVIKSIVIIRIIIFKKEILNVPKLTVRKSPQQTNSKTTSEPALF